MSLHIDLKYTQLLTPRFEKYTRKNDYLFNVRCPLCGDSKKNKSKMRGYIYRKSNDLFYRCHNCGAGCSLGNLIKQLDGNLFKEYLMERYKSGELGKSFETNNTLQITSPKFDKIETKAFDNAERCDMLPEQHFCIQYLKTRRVPQSVYSRLYYTDNYKKLCDEVYPQHDKKITEDKRLVIPFYNEYNDLIAISGRALENADNKLRYVTIRTNSDENKLIYGLDRINSSGKVVLVEGPIDSLFLNNCLASADANLSLTREQLDIQDVTLVFDNEPRNKEILSLMDRAMKNGNKIVIWPNTMIGKDINEFIMNGISSDEIESIISSNTFTGIQAQLKFNMWKRL